MIASFSDPIAVMNGRVWLVPRGVTLKGYGMILEDTRIWTGYRNTIFVSGFGAFLSLALTLAAAYAFAGRSCCSWCSPCSSTADW